MLGWCSDVARCIHHNCHGKALLTWLQHAHELLPSTLHKDGADKVLLAKCVLTQMTCSCPEDIL